jgi:hypothetical protein
MWNDAISRQNNLCILSYMDFEAGFWKTFISSLKTVALIKKLVYFMLIRKTAQLLPKTHYFFNMMPLSKLLLNVFFRKWNFRSKNIVYLYSIYKAFYCSKSNKFYLPLFHKHLNKESTSNGRFRIKSKIFFSKNRNILSLYNNLVFSSYFFRITVFRGNHLWLLDYFRIGAIGTPHIIVAFQGKRFYDIFWRAIGVFVSKTNSWGQKWLMMLAEWFIWIFWD